jgi:hypothetical protein
MDQQVTLEEWVADHGPLWPDVALVVALEVCAQASQMTDTELGAVLGSLNVKGIIRGSTGGWEWRPTRAASPAAGATDADVVERLGALLFHALTGGAVADPLAEETAVQTRLRHQRPDLTPAVADLTVRALSTRQSRPWPLDRFARDVSRVLGRVPSLEQPQRRRGVALVTTTAALALAIGMWWNARAAEGVESHGLTESETILVDVVEERAQGFALMDEHTAAIQEYERLARSWSARVPPEDPRLAWNVVHQAWVRTLRGDRLTAEQHLGSVDGATTGLGAVDGTTARLEATLGDGHPYTRAARLELAATLEARGATQAAGLREQTENRTRELIGDTSVLLSGVPTPAGVVAHLAPNAPEREGFRRAKNGGYYTPLTSIQRLRSGGAGWRLHVIAQNACRTEVVVQDPPRLITVTTARGADGGWDLQIGGVDPPVAIHAAGGQAKISLVGAPDGSVEARLLGGRAATSRIDIRSAPPKPPYTTTFTDSDACRLVWLEIPFPFQPKS